MKKHQLIKKINSIILLLLLGLCLLGCKDNTSLQQTSVTVNVPKAGMLDSLLSNYRKEVIDTLIIMGKVNEIDLITVKYLKNLSFINLEKAEFPSKNLKQYLLANGNQTQIIKLPEDQSLFYSLNPLDINTTYDYIPISIDGILFKDEMTLYSRGVKDSILIISTVNTNKDVVCKDLSLYSEVYEGINYPRIFINYKQKVNGYRVKVIWFPFIYEQGYTDYGLAILFFQNDTSEFYLYNNVYHDDELYQYMPLKDGDTISIDYIPKKPNEYLADNNPFFFQDVDFDGKDELLITKWNCGSRGSSTYNVYKMSEKGNVYLINEEPFNDMENGHTEFDPLNKTITSRFSSSAFNYVIYTYKQVKHERIDWDKPETFYKFELTKADIYDDDERRIYIKENNRYKLIKEEKISINQQYE